MTAVLEANAGRFCKLGGSSHFIRKHSFVYNMTLLFSQGLVKFRMDVPRARMWRFRECQLVGCACFRPLFAVVGFAQ